jgi:hypothetical protein
MPAEQPADALVLMARAICEESTGDDTAWESYLDEARAAWAVVDALYEIHEGGQDIYDELDPISLRAECLERACDTAEIANNPEVTDAILARAAAFYAFVAGEPAKSE